MNTTDQTDVTEPRPVTAGAPPGKSPATTTLTGRLGWLAGPIAAGWLVSGAAVLAHVDWVLLPLLVLAVSSLLRVGRNVVDRLLLGTVVTAGALVAGGLLFSLWPWRLSPLPVAGCLFTAVAVVAWLGDRRPKLPRRFSLSDLMILGTGLFVLVAGVRPLLRLSALGRFVFASTSEDRAAHFALFDTVHRLGSYPFFHQATARVSLQTPAEATYPTGSHFLYAIVDVFIRSNTDPGPVIAEFNRYILLVLGGYAFFVLSTVWAARWILTPLVEGWRLLAATSAVAAVLVGGPLMTLVTAGFDSQVLGTAFVGLAAAVAIRPPASIGDRVTLFGALTILIAYTYYLYLPLVAIAILASFVVHRRFLRLHWRTLLVSAVLVGAVSVIPLYFAATSTLDLGAQALASGATMRIQRSMLVAVTVASLAVLVAPAALRQRRIRVTSLLIGALLGVILLFGAYQTVKLGTTSYYFEKLWVCYFVVGLICSATLVTFLGPLRGPTVRHPRHPWVREAGAGAVAAAIAFTTIAGFGIGSKFADTDTGSWGGSSLGMWFTGRQIRHDAVGEHLRDLGTRGLLADGVPTLFLVSNVAYENWRVTFTNATLNRINGEMKESIVPVLDVHAGAAPVEHERQDKALSAVEKAVSASKRPLRIVVRDRELAAAITQMIAAKPTLHDTVVLLPNR
jgi:hypothetical protein